MTQMKFGTSALADYAEGFSECCDEPLHRPAGGQGVWFCKSCGKQHHSDTGKLVDRERSAVCSDSKCGAPLSEHIGYKSCVVGQRVTIVNWWDLPTAASAWKDAPYGR